MVSRLKTCRICKGKNLHPFLNLGPMPLPNGFLDSKEINYDEPLYPLLVGFCRDCSLMQLIDVVDPKIMFRNYVYIPSASQTRLENFRTIVSELLARKKPGKNALAVDIGSNDGSLLVEFKKMGITPLGVDPAENLSKIAQLKGIPTLNTYFSAETADKIVRRNGHAHYITATNVVAHINNLHDFFSGVSRLLDKNGIFLCEFPYVVDLLEKKLFDTIYQEHLSYFAVRPLLKVITMNKLNIIDIRRTPIDGGALRLMIARADSSFKENSYTVRELLDLERRLRLDQVETYEAFANDVQKVKQDIRSVLLRLKKEGKSIAGYGAAARGNILLNYCGISKSTIDFIVDSTPYKQGLFTPGTHIQIFPEEEILRRQPEYVVILAWNFASEIMKKQQEYKRRGGTFIIPIPYVKIIS